MRLPADSRRRAEQVASATAVLLTVLALWTAGSAGSDGTPIVVDTVSLAGALPGLTTGDWSRPLRIDAASLPGPRERDWLSAMRRAGRLVGWSARSGLSSLAMEIEPASDPAGGDLVRIAGDRGPTMTLGDAVSVLDTLTPTSAIAFLRAPSAAGAVTVAYPGARASGQSSDSLLRRRLVVLGQAGWETKFVVAALEERGWAVDVRAEVAPGVVVGAASLPPLDTAHVAAVIAIDSSAVFLAAALRAFVRDGGGLVLEPNAASQPAFRALAPAAVGSVRPATSLQYTAAAPRRALATRALVELRPGAVALDIQDGQVVVAAMRAGAGRVVEIGYDESWRWRMSDTPGALVGHRSWWAEVVASAAYRSWVQGAVKGGVDPAPRAAWFAALGEPLPPSTRSGFALVVAITPWLIGLSALLLLTAWVSRRTRGAA